MKRYFSLLPIIVSMFLFISCAAGNGAASGLTDSLRAVTQTDCLVDITASFPEREAEFKLGYTYLRDGDDRAEVVEPEEISGVAFSVSGEDVTLSFDGANLELGSLGDISPLTALPKLISAWTGGEILDAQNTKIFDRDAIMTVHKQQGETSELEYRTWFSKDNSIPLYAEIFSDGKRVIQCEFEKVVTK